MPAETLSLGIPVYNQAGTIAQTIRSALEQSQPFDEILVIDNHCTDGTTELLKQFVPMIRIVSPPQHLSMVDNWNFCVGEMSGTWFTLLSGDDLLKPTFCSQVKAAIAAHDDAVLVRTDWDNIDDTGVTVNAHKQYSVSALTRPPKTWREQLTGPKVNFAAFAAKRSAWRQVGGFPADFHLFQDWMFWLRLAPLGAFVRVPACLAQYRTQHRPDLEPKRVRLRLRDEYRYAIEVLPALPWGPAPNLDLIRSVQAGRLREFLAYAARFPGTVSDDESLAMLESWARSVGREADYQRWLAGKSVVSPLARYHPLRLAKRMARGLLASIRA